MLRRLLLYASSVCIVLMVGAGCVQPNADTSVRLNVGRNSLRLGEHHFVVARLYTCGGPTSATLRHGVRMRVTPGTSSLRSGEGVAAGMIDDQCVDPLQQFSVKRPGRYYLTLAYTSGRSLARGESFVIYQTESLRPTLAIPLWAGGALLLIGGVWLMKRRVRTMQGSGD